MKWKWLIFIHYAWYDYIYCINIDYLNSQLSAFHYKTPQMTSNTLFSPYIQSFGVFLHY